MGSLKRCHYEHYVVSRVANKGLSDLLIWGLQRCHHGVSRGTDIGFPEVSIWGL